MEPLEIECPVCEVPPGAHCHGPDLLDHFARRVKALGPIRHVDDEE
ncbi:MAG: hypothetical protein NTX33_05875 [Propionibacteriales bacterium]|nr:hypothetical protein [Propionibacteriales bacterium]